MFWRGGYKNIFAGGGLTFNSGVEIISKKAACQERGVEKITGVRVVATLK